MSGVTRGALDPLPRVNGGYSAALKIRRGCRGVGRSGPNDPRLEGVPARLPGSVSAGVRSAWGRPPRPPSRRAGYLFSPPSQQIPPAALEQLGKAVGPSPGVSSLPRRRGCPSLPSPLPKTQRCGWVWGVFQLPRLPLGQHLRQERRRRWETCAPADAAPGFPSPSPCASQRCQDGALAPGQSGHGAQAGQTAGKPHPHILPASPSSSSPGARSVGEAVPALPSGHVTGQLSSPPSHPAAAGPRPAPGPARPPTADLCGRQPEEGETGG